jgi:hypothetical protein
MLHHQLLKASIDSKHALPAGSQLPKQALEMAQIGPDRLI